jgi:hypothetical protein
MVIFLALLVVLIIVIVVGLLWHGTVLIGDRRALDRLARHLETERRMAAATQATLQAMRRTAQEAWRGDAS